MDATHVEQHEPLDNSARFRLVPGVVAFITVIVADTIHKDSVVEVWKDLVSH